MAGILHSPEPERLRAVAGISPGTQFHALHAAADEIEALRAVVAAIFEDDDGILLAEVGSASVLFPFTEKQNAAIRRALGNDGNTEASR